MHCLAFRPLTKMIAGSNSGGAMQTFFGGFQTSQKDTFITFGKEMEPFIISKSGNTQWFVVI